MSALEVDLWRPARPIVLGLQITGRVVLMGYSVKESTGTAGAELDIINGADTTGQVVCPITLLAGESTEDWFGPQGLEMATGIIGNIASGSIKGTIWIADTLGSNRPG